MGIFRELVKNAMPHYLVEKYQHNSENPFASGSFYSPIPSKDEINKFNFNAPLPKTIPGVDLNSNEQLQLLDLFERFYKELPFPDKKTTGFRYYYENKVYTYSDAIFLYCMIRYLKPKKLIEVGSGFSTSVTLDTNEKFMDNSIDYRS
ncbi:hypothetical protein [Chryseobacterium balustinum]|uniref:Class I SAM-dependent methyltransferase n=1 Tax=Chryseobacterium balustinum TaxID=246 RepID=A0AAX2IQS5_9FLAO|nr:hypothetical protein [Chryseobacterium balustinum]AZB28268.1 hypothetical protein EB354_02780 [Chryseobacterium balustinum]SKB90019.1 hypothetical protein SAMN05421800_11362 [Chryseobacterium balustinum]SQA92301.1 Uncharacterised protein [Chryseobacterium balustinum]